mgnify:CR=1 FL=1
MKRSEKSTKILSKLNELYPNPQIPLSHNNPFTLLVAVMLSAQSTDKKVNQVTPTLFAVAKTPAEMVKLKVEHIEQLIREIGLAPTKAKNIHRMSQQLIDTYQGEVPEKLEEMETLAGVGHKTASVVFIQAFGKPAFPVDTHIHRLAARWGLSNGMNVGKTEIDLKKCFSEKHWNKLHLQIIYFGREYCPANYHDLNECPICSWAATKKRIVEEQKKNLRLRKKT